MLNNFWGLAMSKRNSIGKRKITNPFAEKTLPLVFAKLLAMAALVSFGAVQAEDYNLDAPWSLDFSFGSFGMVDAQIPYELIHVGDLETFNHNSIVEQSADRLIHAHLAASGLGFFLQRFDQDGNRDARFASAAGAQFSLPQESTSIRLVRDSTGRLYVGLGRSNAVTLCSFTDNGVLREDFRGSKTTRNDDLPLGCIEVLSDSPNFGNSKAAFQLQVDSRDRVVVAGQASDTGMFIARLDNEGGPDRTFGTSGDGRIEVRHRLLNGESGTREIAFADLSLAEASIYLTERRTTGEYLYFTHVFKITAQGSLDASFGLGGELSLMFCHDRVAPYRGEPCVSSWALGDVSAYKTAVDSNNQLLIAAQLNSPFFCAKGFDPTDLNNICPNQGLLRITPRGELDSSFGSNGLSSINQQLPPYIRVMTDAGIERARFSSGTPFELLTSTRKGEYATLATQANTVLIGRSSMDPIYISYLGSYNSHKDLILTINTSGQLNVEAALLNFGTGAPTNCDFTGAGPLLYAQGVASSLYVYAEGARCSGSTINPLFLLSEDPVFFMSRIYHQAF